MKDKRSKKPSSDRHLLYGVNPVLEALRARRLPDQITIAEGARDERLRELIELARSRGVVINYSARATLDREAGSTHHQSVIARLAAPDYADADDLLESIATRVGGQKIGRAHV